MPFGKYSPHPFSREEMRKAIGTPLFAPGARLKVENGPDAVSLFIPRADGNLPTRAYAYDVVVTGANKAKPLVMSVFATGGNLSPGREPDAGVTRVDIPVAKIPPDDTLEIAVTPVTSLGTRGATLYL